jgi:two-component system response regulator YesN
LIVDDEPWVTYGIANMVDWEALGFQVLGEAYDGLTAWEIIREQNPDVVISDIRMPGLDGIQLLDRLRQEQMDTEVILVSGYSEFEYAQRAIQYGAFDYLLKQIDQVKLVETLTRLIDKLDNKRKGIEELDLLLNDLFDLFEPDNKIKIQNFLMNKGLESSYPHFRFISCLSPMATASVGADVCDRYQGANIVRFRTGQNKVSFLLNYDELNNPIVMLDFVSNHLTSYQYLGISSLGVFSTPIAKLYQESDIALFSRFSQPDQNVIEYKEIVPSAGLTKKLWNLELTIKEQNRELIGKRLEELKEECAAERLYVDQLSNIYNQLVAILYKYYSDSSSIQDLEYTGYYQIVRSFSSMDQLFDSIHMFFEDHADMDIPISNEFAKRIISHIDAHFTEDLVLSQLAKQNNMSLGYLSGLIKKETGKTYSEYITNKRLVMAKELLADSSLSIHDIVQRVGYKDYFHFNKLFKKYFGITPSKYRKL